MRARPQLSRWITEVVLMLWAGGCQHAPPQKPVPADPFSQIHDVPIFPGPQLPPLDFKKLSGGKVTRYFIGGDNPHSPTQEAMLETCRQLPLKNATAGPPQRSRPRIGCQSVSA